MPAYPMIDVEMRYHPWRWIAVSIFVLSSTLNYLDRALVGIMAPFIMKEFALNQQQIGWIISIFSITYAAMSLPAGWLLDRLGVNKGIAVAASWWSLASLGTGLVGTWGAMGVCRAALGMGEAAGVPAFGKVNGEYLKPEERALGAAVNGVGISVGLALAPLSLGIAAVYGWRRPFVISGILGLLWIPIWLQVSRRFQAPRRPAVPTRSDWTLLRQKPIAILMLANVLWMSGYSVWSFWIALYLRGVYHASSHTVQSLAWIPPLVSNLGGFFGGWLSLLLIRRAVPIIRARQLTIFVSAIGCLSGLGLLTAQSATGATVWIAASFFFVLAGSVNLYALPIDLYGSGRAALAVSALTCAYGVLQTVISPMIGWMGDHHLYRQAAWLVAVPPLLSSLLLGGLPRRAVQQKTYDSMAEA